MLIDVVLDKATGALTQLDDSLLRKLEKVHANTDDLRVEWTEYCLRDCPGAAHVTGVDDAASFHCALHVHHSVHVTMKKWPAGAMGAEAGSFF
jgi:hypothetical protein